MKREDKIDAIWDACVAANPKNLQVGSLVRLRHIVSALRVAKQRYSLGPQGYFFDQSLTATSARWRVRQNDLILQDDDCIDFLYTVLIERVRPPAY